MLPYCFLAARILPPATIESLQSIATIVKDTDSADEKILHNITVAVASLITGP